MSTVMTPGSAPTQAEPLLKTPDPVKTTEAAAAMLSTIIGLVVVMFKLNVPGTVQAALVTLLTAGLSAFLLWHGSRVRAARAIGSGLKAGGSATIKT